MKADAASPLKYATLSSEEAEQMLLSTLYRNPALLDRIEFLEVEAFSQDYTRAIFIELRRQLIDGKPVDLLTLSERIGEQIPLDELQAILDSSHGYVVGAERLAHTITEKHSARKLFKVAEVVTTLAYEMGPVNDRIDKAMSALSSLETADDVDVWVDAYTAALRHTEVLERRESGEDCGITTGLTDLDEMLDGGMQAGNLIVIGARPSMGKTAIALTIALHAAQTHTVGFLSMEMSEADIMDRQTAVLGHLSMGSIKRPKKGLDFSRVVESVELAKTRKFFFSDKGGLNILQVRAKARALKRRHGLDVLVVDYIGLMAGLDPRQSRAYQIEEISRGLKTLAKELGIVVLCLAQVNRNATERASQVPGLSDLRDSGAIEQDADVVGFIHRPIMVDPTLTEQQHYGLLRLAKNRQGRCGDVHLYYEGEQTRFSAWGGPPPTGKAQNQTKGFNRD